MPFAPPSEGELYPTFAKEEHKEEGVKHGGRTEGEDEGEGEGEDKVRG